MEDLERIKSNVAKMASQQAPMSDIDGYIKSEGVTVDDVKNFKPSVSSEGLGYVGKHPVLSLMQPASKTLTGKSIEDYATNVAKSSGMGVQDESVMKLGGDIADIATTPATYAAVPLLKWVGKALGIGAETISNISKFSKPKAQVSLAEEVQNGLAESKHSVIENYGKEYDKIIGESDKKVNLTPAIKKFVDEGQSLTQNPEFVQQLAAKNPQAQKVMDLVKTVTDEKMPEELSAKEADNLSKAIKNLPGIKTKLAQGSKYGFHTVQWSNEDRMLLGLADDIKGGVIEAHPELQGLNKEYGTFMNAYKKVAPDFKIGSTVSRLKNYGSYDPQKKALLEGIVPKSTIDKVKDFSTAEAVSKHLKALMPWLGAAAVGSAGYEAGRIAQHSIP